MRIRAFHVLEPSHSTSPPPTNALQPIPKSTLPLARSNPTRYISPMPLFTRETAASAGRKGAAIRWSTPKPPPVTEHPTTQPYVIPVIITDDYLVRRLARVRDQLDKLDAMMTTEDDPQRIDRLASAQLRLSEQERVLAGRPLPGSRRPGPQRQARATEDVEPGRPANPTSQPPEECSI